MRRSALNSNLLFIRYKGVRRSQKSFDYLKEKNKRGDNLHRLSLLYGLKNFLFTSTVTFTNITALNIKDLEGQKKKSRD